MSQARRRAKTAQQDATRPTERRPRFGPWNERDSSGWSICEVHDYGVMPGTTCLRCRLGVQPS